jgi:hypothetical protein
MDKLLKFIKDKSTKKTPMVTLSVNLEKRHQDWLKAKSVNLSKLVRAIVDKAMRGEDLDL